MSSPAKMSTGSYSMSVAAEPSQSMSVVSTMSLAVGEAEDRALGVRLVAVEAGARDELTARLVVDVDVDCRHVERVADAGAELVVDSPLRREVARSGVTHADAGRHDAAQAERRDDGSCEKRGQVGGSLHGLGSSVRDGFLSFQHRSTLRRRHAPPRPPCQRTSARAVTRY